METTPATSAAAPAPSYIYAPAQDNTAKMAIGAVLLGFAAWKAYGMYQQAQANKEADKSTTDVNSNAAEQLHELIDTTWGAKFLGTKDSGVLDIISNVTDIEAVKAKYSTLTQGGNLIEDMRKGMKGSNFTKAMNILGIKTGIIKPTSTQGKAAVVASTAGTKKAMFAIAKVAGRIRKSPFVQSAWALQPNIVGTAPTGMVAGITYGLPPVLDTANNVWFMPIKIFLDDRTTANAYIASSNVDLIEKRPADAKIYQVSKFNYNNASEALSGLSGTESNLNNLI